MVTLKGRFKGDTGEKLHMLPLVQITESVIEVRKCVGRRLEMLVEQDELLKGCVFQGKIVKRLRIQNLDDGFQEGFRVFQAGG